MRRCYSLERSSRPSSAPSLPPCARWAFGLNVFSGPGWCEMISLRHERRCRSRLYQVYPCAVRPTPSAPYTRQPDATPQRARGTISNSVPLLRREIIHRHGRGPLVALVIADDAQKATLGGAGGGSSGASEVTGAIPDGR